MTSDKLREVLLAQPFLPFAIHLADGRSHEVSHPELMAISPSGRVAYLFQPGDKHDTGHHIDVLLITSLEVRTHRPRESRGRGRKAG